MDVLYPRQSKEDYLRLLKGTKRIRFPFPGDVLNRLVVGRFFSIAYHSPYEWNRQITMECNRAVGYVKEQYGQTEVHYVLLKGWCSLGGILAFFTIWMLLMTILGLLAELPLQELFSNALVWIVAVVATAVFVLITAFHSSITEAGEQGENLVMKLLKYPETMEYV